MFYLPMRLPQPIDSNHFAAPDCLRPLPCCAQRALVGQRHATIVLAAGPYKRGHMPKVNLLSRLLSPRTNGDGKPGFLFLVNLHTIIHGYTLRSANFRSNCGLVVFVRVQLSSH
jgi:hypothetical protein